MHSSLWPLGIDQCVPNPRAVGQTVEMAIPLLVRLTVQFVLTVSAKGNSGLKANPKLAPYYQLMYVPAFDQSVTDLTDVQTFAQRTAQSVTVIENFVLFDELRYFSIGHCQFGHSSTYATGGWTLEIGGNSQIARIGARIFVERTYALLHQLLFLFAGQNELGVQKVLLSGRVRIVEQLQFVQ